jgi:hypothetical protein
MEKCKIISKLFTELKNLIPGNAIEVKVDDILFILDKSRYFGDLDSTGTISVRLAKSNKLRYPSASYGDGYTFKDPDECYCSIAESLSTWSDLDELLSDTLTQLELNYLSRVATDFVTGRHLLGNKEDFDYTLFRLEVQLSISHASLYLILTKRQKNLINGLSNNFFGGLKDMCEQLNLDYIRFINALNK